jgi:hypothetical protein
LGGNVVQPLHHDVAQTKQNQHIYQEAMASAEAPASIIFGFGNPTRLCVLASDIERRVVLRGGMKCSIKGGLDEELFDDIGNAQTENAVTGKTHDLIVIQDKLGFVIRGDFNHAGAVSYSTLMQQKGIWAAFHSTLLPLALHPEKRNKEHYQIVFDELCDIEGLVELARLHVSILPKTIDFNFDDNAVGYDVDEESDETSSSLSSSTS